MINAVPFIREAYLHGLGWGFVIGSLFGVLVVSLVVRYWRRQGS